MKEKIKEKSIEDIYQHLEHRDQILLRPDSTIGTIITEDRNLFVVDKLDDFNNIKIVNKNIKYNPGFLKIVDEILTNASDHFIKTGQVKNIKVIIMGRDKNCKNEIYLSNGANAVVEGAAELRQALNVQ